MTSERLSSGPVHLITNITTFLRESRQVNRFDNVIEPPSWMGSAVLLVDESHDGRVDLAVRQADD